MQKIDRKLLEKHIKNVQKNIPEAPPEKADIANQPFNIQLRPFQGI